MMKKILVWVGLIVFIGLVGFFWIKDKKEKVSSLLDGNVSVVEEVEKSEDDNYPIAEFKQRVTKKSFGDYITPANSPVQPERFSGWHTGVDVEYEDREDEISIKSICDGKIVLSRWVSGYGGTIILNCLISEENYYIIYGHLDPNKIMEIGEVKQGEILGILGQGYSNETDNERKHLHFGIHKNSINLRGYVQNESELEEWIDPLNSNLFY